MSWYEILCVAIGGWIGGSILLALALGRILASYHPAASVPRRPRALRPVATAQPAVRR